MVALDAVAVEGTFARAATRLGYTQSAVSQQIASLERLIGGALFDRPGGPRPVSLTPLGELVLAHARGILDSVDVAADAVARYQAGDIGRVDVGTFQSVSTALLPDIVGRLRAELPDVEIRLYESELDDELLSRLDSAEVDVSFVVGDPPPGFEGRRLVVDPFVLIAPDGTFPDGPVAIADLADRPMIGQQDNSCQRLNEAGLRSAGCDPRYVFRTNDNGAVVAMVRVGMGVAVLPLLCIDPYDSRVSLHPLDPPLPSRVISLAWRSGRTLSPASRHFVSIAEDVCASFEHAVACP